MRVRIENTYVDAGPSYLNVGDIVFVVHSFAVVGHEMVNGEEAAVGKMFSSGSIGYPLSLLLEQMQHDAEEEEGMQLVGLNES